MSAVFDIVPPVLVAAAPVPSCTTCRRSRHSGDVLYCNELRSNAVGGVVIVAVSAAKKSNDYERMCAQTAERCKFYQEEK